VELLKQAERDIRLPAVDFITDGLELVVHAERANLVASRAQRAYDVVLGFPDVDFLFGVAGTRFRRNQVRMQKHKDA
jgi:hypothetical protein